jgi:UDP-glucuronate decarboxylase
LGNIKRMKRILVTGGAGFLGSHLVDRLVERGDEVLCVDNLFTGSLENVNQHNENPRFKFLHHDITLPLDVEVDQIYNLACPASPEHYQYDPIHTTKTSILGAINMLDLAKQLNARIFQASTSEVYGDPLMHPQKESYWGNVNPVGIRSCYDEGKRCAETLFFDYYRQHGIDIRVARIFNTYGPRMQINDGRVVSNFITQAIKGSDITLYGDGRQTRSFCYVDDLIESFLRFMDRPRIGSDGFEVTGPLNLGNNVEYTMLELAEKVLKIAKSKSALIFLPLPSDDPVKRKPDICLAKKYLDGWSPEITLEQGLLKTEEYFRSVL